MDIDTATGTFSISDVLVKAWATRFPAADLQREHPLMVLWLLKNPSRRPRNAIRFIENWLRKVNERELKNMETVAQRGRASAERVGERYGVKARPGESQEDFNRRVLAACAGSVVRRVA